MHTPLALILPTGICFLAGFVICGCSHAIVGNNITDKYLQTETNTTPNASSIESAAMLMQHGPSGFTEETIPAPITTMPAENNSLIQAITAIPSANREKSNSLKSFATVNDNPEQEADKLPLNKFGLFGCILAFIPLLSLFGFSFSIVAYQQMKNSPNKYRGKTMVDIGLIVGFIISVLSIVLVIGMLNFAD